MTREEAVSCENTIVLLFQLAKNLDGFLHDEDVVNCEKIIKLLREQEDGDDNG